MEHTIKRWIIFLLGIQFLAIGIVCNTRTNLGVAAFTSVFYAISQIYDISLGASSIILYIMLIMIQIILLRKVPLPIVLQIPFSLAFGTVTNLYDQIIPFHCLNLAQAFLLLITAFLFTSMGVFFTVQCNLVITPVEGIVNTISKVFRFKFGAVKNCFDISMILITVILCLFLHQPIFGIGMGTILSAVVLGRLIAFYENHIILFPED